MRLQTTTWQPLSTAAAAVLTIKLLAFATDPTPLFFMGDSQAFVATAVGGPFPFDRSFTYPLLIRWLALWPATLAALVFAQVLAGAATAVILACILLRFFKAPPAIAVPAAVACALDPLQIIHERLVLTEAFAQLLFAGYLLLSIDYVTRRRIRSILLSSLTGILLVSLRVVYLPLVLGNAVLVPCLAFAPAPAPQPPAPRARRLMGHLAVSLLATFCLHAGFRQLTGAILNGPASYLEADGFFMAAAWAPLLKPLDATDPRAARVVERLQSDQAHPLQDRSERESQRWQPGGLIDELGRAFNGNRYDANRAAREMALRAMRRDPLGVVTLTMGTYKDYWTILPSHRERLLVEQGSRSALPAEFLSVVRTRFGLDASTIALTMTPSKRYHLAGWPWYALLLLSPLVSGISVVVCSPARRAAAAVGFLDSCVLLAATCAGTELPFWRYLSPLALTTLLALAVIANASRFRLRPVGAVADSVA